MHVVIIFFYVGFTFHVLVSQLFLDLILDSVDLVLEILWL
jgi:hypothetical protein